MDAAVHNISFSLPLSLYVGLAYNDDDDDDDDDDGRVIDSTEEFRSDQGWTAEWFAHSTNYTR